LVDNPFPIFLSFFVHIRNGDSGGESTVF
jgi:hypothetical protein